MLRTSKADAPGNQSGSCFHFSKGPQKINVGRWLVAMGNNTILLYTSFDTFPTLCLNSSTFGNLLVYIQRLKKSCPDLLHPTAEGLLLQILV